MAAVNKDFVVKNGLVVNTSLIFASNGQVGVNTASPDAAFTVAGSANVRGDFAVSGNLNVIGTVTSNTAVLQTFHLTTGNSTVNAVVSNTDVRIGNSTVNSAFTSTSLAVGVLTINTTASVFSSGNVSFGTAAQTSRLTVNGQIEMTNNVIGLKFGDGSVQNTAFVPGALTPAAGANTQIQYNTGTNAFGANAGFTFNPATGALFSNGVVTAANSFQAGDGSAAAPTHTFASNQNSGFFKSAASEISLSLAGVTRWVYQVAGSILTGNLTVNGNTVANGTLTVNALATFSNVTATGPLIANSASFAGNVTYSNNVVSAVRLSGWGETSNFFGNANGTITLDLANTNVFRIEEFSNTTLVFSNPPANNVSYGALLHITHKSPGGQQTTFPASCTKDGGVIPPETTTSGALDVWSIWTLDGGATYALSLVHKDLH